MSTPLCVTCFEQAMSWMYTDTSSQHNSKTSWYCCVSMSQGLCVSEYSRESSSNTTQHHSSGHVLSVCLSCLFVTESLCLCWAEAHIKIARMTLTVKLDRNWSSFQLANSAPPLSVTDSATAPSASILVTASLSACNHRCRSSANP